MQTYSHVLSPGGFGLELTVVGNVTDSLGRWPSALGNVVLLNSKHLLGTFKRALDKIPVVALANAAAANGSASALGSTTETPFTDQMMTFPLDEYAFSVVAQFENRVDIYTSKAQCIDRIHIEIPDPRLGKV